MAEATINENAGVRRGACAFVLNAPGVHTTRRWVLTTEKPMIGNATETCNGVESYQKNKQRQRCRNCGRPVQSRYAHRMGCPLLEGRR
ncbi:hypothetical protein [Halocatena salina]|uniref:Uncharacterized protein n=1 Tax=Halocatena salina TaxID=2934340 RepID=A0A8U0A1I2_9EURY|nr:hypothetical protein [Halocatena salina]UPM41913.1 hypothetical protein MW046_07995 [Halocatena salina]